MAAQNTHQDFNDRGPNATNLVADCGASLWGKSQGLDTPYPLLAHLIDSGAAAQILTTRLVAGPAQTWLRTILGGNGVESADVTQLLAVITSWHDVGKAQPGFQSANRDASETLFQLLGTSETETGKTEPHARIGQLAAAVDLRGSLFAAGVVGGHHGQFTPLRAARSESFLAKLGGGQVWDQLRAELMEVTATVFGAEPTGLERPVGLALVTGIVSVADWLVSDQEWLTGRLPDTPALRSSDGARDWLRESSGLLEDRISDAGLGRGPMKAKPFSKLFPGWQSRGLQRITEQALSGSDLGAGGIVGVMAPTGEGKTEAGLLAAGFLGSASGKSGLYVGLPTIATADQMLERVQQFVADQTNERLAITLNHGLASLDLNDTNGSEVVSTDSGTRSAAATWLQGRHRAMLAPIAVGTVDQVLVAALAVKYGFIRHVALFDKTVIIDEAHSYDPYMQALLIRALEWLGAYQVPVVLLSATIPTKTAQTMFEAYRRGYNMDPNAETGPPDISYPGLAGWLPNSGTLSIRDQASSERVVAVKQLRYRPNQESIDCVLGELERVFGSDPHAAVAVVVNTVKTGQHLYRAIQERFGPESMPSWLLHSRFTIGDRSKLTREIVDRFGKHSTDRAGIVVATQVIEQSLDLDFDLVISELAPVAQLLQRVGRCHRHQRADRPTSCATPTLLVLVPWEPNTGLVLPRSWKWIYHEVELRRTEQLLGESCTIRVPQDVQGIVDQVNAVDFSDPDGMVAAAEAERFAANSQDRATASQVMIPSPWNVDLTTQTLLTSSRDGDQFAATRLGAASVLVLVADRDGVLFDGFTPSDELSKGDVRRIISNAVPLSDLPGSWLKKVNRSDQPAGWERWSRLRDVFIVEGDRHEQMMTVTAEDKNIALTHDYGLEEL